MLSKNVSFLLNLLRKKFVFTQGSGIKKKDRADSKSEVLNQSLDIFLEVRTHI
jgi:hypothetical protein